MYINYLILIKGLNATHYNSTLTYLIVFFVIDQLSPVNKSTKVSLLYHNILAHHFLKSSNTVNNNNGFEILQ